MTINAEFAPIRRVDVAKLDAADRGARYSQMLLDHDSGARNCTIGYIRTPPGGGSPAGLHVHEVDQIFYILAGTMSVEIDGEVHALEPGSLVVFAAGVPHRNWNEGPEPTVHLALNVPLPDPGKPFASPFEAVVEG